MTEPSFEQRRTQSIATTQFLRAVGLVAQVSAVMERSLGSVYEAVLHAPAGSAVAHGLGVDPTLQALRAVRKRLIEEMGETDDLAALGAAIERSAELWRRRTQVIHGVWEDLPGIDPMLSRLFRRWGAEVERELTTDTVEQLVRELLDHSNELMRLMIKALDDVFVPPTWTGRYRLADTSTDEGPVTDT